MTKEMQELIDRDLNAALESGDAKLVDRALINSQRALADCQLKTAERVKTIAADHPVLVGGVKEIKALGTDATITLGITDADAEAILSASVAE